jgi:hypothetical protein
LWQGLIAAKNRSIKYMKRDHLTGMNERTRAKFKNFCKYLDFASDGRGE